MAKYGIWEVRKGRNDRAVILCNKEDYIAHPDHICKINGLVISYIEKLAIKDS